MAIKKYDFVELEYSGRLKTNNEVFDTTDEKLAKEAGIYNKKMKYGPVIVCIGEEQLVKGLDDQVEGKELGKYTIEVPAEQAFGKKDPKLLQLISLSKFKKEQVQPMPGMQVQVDNTPGIVKTVSGGRVIVDFNNPLSGHDLVYDINLIKIVTDKAKQIESYVSLFLNNSKVDVEVKEETAEIKLPFDMPEQLQKPLIEKIQNVVKIKEIKFVNTLKKEKPKKEEKPTEAKQASSETNQ